MRLSLLSSSEKTTPRMPFEPTKGMMNLSVLGNAYKINGAHLISCLMMAVLALGYYLWISNAVVVQAPDARINVDEVYLTVNRSRELPPSELDYGSQFLLRKDGSLQPDLNDQLEVDPAMTNVWMTALMPLNVPPNRLWTLYFPDIPKSASVYVNGRQLGTPAHFYGSEIGRLGHQSAAIVIPNGSLSSGVNEIQLQFHSSQVLSKGIGVIQPFFLGPSSELQPMFQRQVFFTVTFPKLVAGLLFFTSIAFFLIWKFGVQERLYGWFSLVCICWFLHTAINYQLIMFSGFAELPAVVLRVLLICISLSIVGFSHSGKRAGHRANSILTGFLLLSLLCLLELFFGQTAYPEILVSFVFTITLVVALRELISERAGDGVTRTYLPQFCVYTLIYFSISNIFTLFNSGGIAPLHSLMQFSAPILIGVLALHMVRDYVLSSNALQVSNETLEQRVQDRTLALEQSMHLNKKHERDSVLYEERTRIMMEMHDGLGAHLVSIISRLENDAADPHDIQQEAQSALDDLRLIVDSISPVENDLPSALGMFRHRLEKTIAGSPFTLNWNVSDVDEVDDLGPHKVLHVLRILQEAANNALKHSGGNQLTLATGQSGSEVFVSLSDNGVGRASGCRSGQGIRNMNRRAERAGICLNMDSSCSGTTVSLQLPRVMAHDSAQDDVDSTMYPVGILPRQCLVSELNRVVS